MTLLDLTPDEVLRTTRAVRKRLDFARPVEDDVIRECVAAAMQAPSGSNNMTMQFVVVQGRRQARGDRRDLPPVLRHLQDAGRRLRRIDRRRTPTPNRPSSTAWPTRPIYLADHMGEAPALVHRLHGGPARRRAGDDGGVRRWATSCRACGASCSRHGPAGSARRGRRSRLMHGAGRSPTSSASRSTRSSRPA